MKVRGLLFRTQPLQHCFTQFSLLKHELLSESKGGRSGNWGQIGYARTAAKLHTQPEAASQLSQQTPAFLSHPIVPKL